MAELNQLGVSFDNVLAMLVGMAQGQVNMSAKILAAVGRGLPVRRWRRRVQGRRPDVRARAARGQPRTVSLKCNPDLAAELRALSGAAGEC